MSMLRILWVMIFTAPLVLFAQQKDSLPQTSLKVSILPVTIKAPDGIEIRGEQYLASDTLPWMLLCHQAGYSRAEYDETYSRFVKLGFNCLAIDQRSGDSINGERNITNANAIAAGKKTNYLDAEQDIVAALDYLYKKSGKKVTLVGSSYSASLVLKIATGNDKVRAVIAFSPGEYFGNKLDLKKSIATLDCPVFITSSHSESAKAGEIANAVSSKVKVHFVPEGKGRHGSSTLWKDCENRNEYWIALIAFTNKI